MEEVKDTPVENQESEAIKLEAESEAKNGASETEASEPAPETNSSEKTETDDSAADLENVELHKKIKKQIEVLLFYYLLFDYFLRNGC